MFDALKLISEISIYTMIGAVFFAYFAAHDGHRYGNRSIEYYYGYFGYLAIGAFWPIVFAWAIFTWIPKYIAAWVFKKTQDYLRTANLRENEKRTRIAEQEKAIRIAQEEWEAEERERLNVARAS